MKFGIVIVEYKSVKLTIDFVKHLQDMLTISAEIVIVSNLCSDAAVKEFATSLPNLTIYPAADVSAEGYIYSPLNSNPQAINQMSQHDNVSLLVSQENLGFAKGCNLGAEFLIKYFQSDILLFANNDIEITSTEVVPFLIEKLYSNSRIGMIGPEIVGLDGRRQSPEPYIPMVDRFLLMYVSTLFMSKEKKRKRFSLDYAEQAKEGFHFKIMGSFFLMRSEVFIEIDGFDPNTFLYGEEIILAKRLERTGKKAYFLPSVRVIHKHGQTISKHLSHSRMTNVKLNSEFYFYTNYCNVPKWKACIILAFARLINWIK